MNPKYPPKKNDAGTSQGNNLPKYGSQENIDKKRAESKAQLAASIFRMLMHMVRAAYDDFGRDNVAAWTLAHVERPGHLAERATDEERTQLHHLLWYAAEMIAIPPDERLLRAYTERAADAVLTVFAERWRRTLLPQRQKVRRDTLQAALMAEKTEALNDEELVRRAVRRALNTGFRRQRGTTPLPLSSESPLRQLLDLPEQGTARLPNTDMRVRLASTNEAMSKLIEKAAVFSEEFLRPLLGDQLWNLCRPIGYADRDQKIIQAEVPTSAHLFEMQWYKAQILYALRKHPALAHITDIRFVAPIGR